METGTEIAQKTIHCLEAFDHLRRLVAPGVSKVEEYLTFNAVDDEAGRFSIWAGNIGAYQKGPASLDKRLAEAWHIRSQVLTLLTDLKYSVDEIVLIAAGIRPQRVTTDDDSDSLPSDLVLSDFESDIATTEAESEPATEEKSKDAVPQYELQLLQKAVNDSITALFMLSIAIRGSSRRDMYARSDKLPPLDDKYDIDYIWQNFPAARRNGWLIERLGKANTRRRQYFRYRAKHERKLSRRPAALEEKEDALRLPGASPFAEVSMARSTTIARERNIGRLEDQGTAVDSSRVDTTATTYELGGDQQSVYSDVAESTSSINSSLASDSRRVRLRIPPRPGPGANDAPFVCPFCREIQQASKKNSWKLHVLSDLLPYVCTFESCPTKMFPTKEQWWQHELQMHRKYWRCCFPDCQVVLRAGHDLQRHFRDAHPGSVTDAQMPLVLETCSHPQPRFFARECPFCDSWASRLEKQGEGASLPTTNEGPEVKAKQFRNHVAKHMLQVALYALPKLDSPEEEDDDQDHESDRRDKVDSSDSDVEGGSSEDDVPISTTKTGLPARPKNWDKNIKSSDNDLVLYSAAKKGPDALRSALDTAEHDTDLAMTAKDGKTALHQAARAGEMRALQVLHDAGADLHFKDKTGSTPLHLAADQGHYEVVLFLLDRGADVEDEDASGATALRRATGKGHIAVMTLLLQRGADVNSQDKKGWAPLHKAAERGHLGAVELLLLHGALVDADDVDGYTPLHRAINRERFQEVVEALLAAGANIDTRCRKGPTPLQTASGKNHHEVVRFLVGHGADLNMEGPRNMRAIHRAVYNCHDEVVRVLLESGADPNIQDDDGWNALYGAASMGSAALVKTILECASEEDRNAAICARDNTGMTALHRAVVEGFQEIVTILARMGAEVNTTDDHMNTPLHSAVVLGRPEVVGVLLGLGASREALDSRNRRPVDLAEADEIKRLLTE